MSKKILLVEDEALIAMSEAQMLKKHGFEVVSVYNGEKAIEAVDSDPDIALILLDIDLGKGMDGTEAAEEILKKKDIPVVFLSSHTEAEVVEKTEGITSYGYIVKNSGETVLLASIRMAFRLFDARMKEKEHKEKLQFQATILDRIGDYVTATDLNGRITYVNEAECVLFGKPREAIIGQTTAMFGEDPGYGATQKEIVETTIKKGSWRGEVVNFDRNNNRIVMDCRTWPIRDSNGVAHSLVGIATDITEHKKIEDKLKKSEEKFRRLFETMTPGVVYHSADGTIISANPAAEKIMGISVDQMSVKTSMDPRRKMVDEEGKEVPGSEQPAMIALKSGEKVGPVDRAVFIPERNEYLWLSITAIPLFTAGDDKPYQVYTTFDDITERKRMEELLLQKEQQYRCIYNSLRDALIVVNKNREITDCNTAFTELFGYSLSEIQGKTTAILFASKDEYEQLGRRMQKQGENSDFIYQPLYQTKTGEVFRGEKKVQYLRDDDGKPVGFIGIIRDITECKRAEEYLREALKEKDFLMKELNHRVKNNLLMVSSLISLKDSETEIDLSDIQHQIEAISLIHEKLCKTENVTEINCRDYCDDLLNSIFTSFTTRKVRIEKEIEDIGVSTKTAMALGLIINEIATNAIKHGFSDKEEAVFSAKMKQDTENNRYELTLSNTGNPFPASADIESTDSLGLRLIYALVDQIDGTIELQKKPNPVFTIKFPEA